MNTKNLFSRKVIKKTPHLACNFTSLIPVSVSETSSISDFSPIYGDLCSCIASLQSCAIHQNLIRGKKIHSWMIMNEFLKSPFSVTSLINMYSKCNRPDDAMAVFDGAGTRNLFAWNAIIAGLVTNGLSRDAFEMYQKMRGENVAPDKFTFPCVIKACTDLQELQETEKIHAGLLKIGLESDAFIASALISFYLKFDLAEGAGQVFEELSQRDVVLWNAMINGYAGIGKFNLAMEIFERMGKEGITPSKFTVTGILSVFTMLEDLSNGRKIHGFVKKIGFEPDTVVFNSLIDMYGKCKCVEDAREIFETMPQRDIFSWNSIISIYEQTGDHSGTMRLFYRMRGAGVRPDSVTISSILPACSHMAALMHGREIHGYMIVNGLRRKDGEGDGDVYVHNAVMDMYAKCGSLRDARLLFDRTIDRDTASWNIMIMGYGMHGHGHDALDLFSNMCSARVKPDEVTFVGVLSACSHAGLVEPGQEILACMESAHGVVPTIEHYACAIDMLGRAGQLNEAYELALAMPIEPNPVVWRAFLAACRQHGNAALAEVAAKRLFEIDPGHCGSYVLLSNIYGAVGRYEDVSDVRAIMRVRNVKKTPGCSWIELNMRVHVFVTGDRAHSESDRIYAILHLLIGRLREFGYTPDVRHVLQCVE